MAQGEQPTTGGSSRQPEAAQAGQGDGRHAQEVTSPSRAVRLASMAQALLAQVRDLDLDEAARHRIASIHNTTVEELQELLSEPLQEEVERLELTLPAEPSDAELRVAQAQLVGWLEGLFHGIRSTMIAHQLASQEELARMQQQGMLGRGEEQGRPGGQYL